MPIAEVHAVELFSIHTKLVLNHVLNLLLQRVAPVAGLNFSLYKLHF